MWKRATERNRKCEIPLFMTVEIKHKWWILSPDSNWFGCASEGDRDTCTQVPAARCRWVRKTVKRYVERLPELRVKLHLTVFSSRRLWENDIEASWKQILSPPSDRIPFLVANRATFSHLPQHRLATSPQSREQFDKIMADKGERGEMVSSLTA